MHPYPPELIERADEVVALARFVTPTDKEGILALYQELLDQNNLMSPEDRDTTISNGNIPLAMCAPFSPGDLIACIPFRVGLIEEVPFDDFLQHVESSLRRTLHQTALEYLSGERTA